MEEVKAVGIVKLEWRWRHSSSLSSQIRLGFREMKEGGEDV